MIVKRQYLPSRPYISKHGAFIWSYCSRFIEFIVVGQVAQVVVSRKRYKTHSLPICAYCYKNRVTCMSSISKVLLQAI